jgi:hypothetical protein
MKYIFGITFFLLLRLACWCQTPGYELAEQAAKTPRYWGNFNFTAGAWLPTSRLHLLGNHPSVGMQGGIRNEKNELDIGLSVRFIRSSNNYVVLRNDSLYTLDDYVGGYIGVDYTHYFFQETHFQSGLMIGAGYDGFTIGNQGSDGQQPDYLKPLDIGSFNFNVGLRLSYSFKPSLYLALMPRYNFIRYDNRGGTSLVGNAFSIDFGIGGNF